MDSCAHVRAVVRPLEHTGEHVVSDLGQSVEALAVRRDKGR